uniref:GLOBIN domain-containing protein n=1 Tax=Macrostomum lignano TaxID=282301 RepID=A0A1I8I8E6_9PLAT
LLVPLSSLLVPLSSLLVPLSSLLVPLSSLLYVSSLSSLLVPLSSLLVPLSSLLAAWCHQTFLDVELLDPQQLWHQLVSKAFRHHPDAVGSFNRLHQLVSKAFRHHPDAVGSFNRLHQLVSRAFRHHPDAVGTFNRLHQLVSQAYRNHPDAVGTFNRWHEAMLHQLRCPLGKDSEGCSSWLPESSASSEQSSLSADAAVSKSDEDEQADRLNKQSAVFLSKEQKCNNRELFTAQRRSNTHSLAMSPRLTLQKRGSSQVVKSGNGQQGIRQKQQTVADGGGGGTSRCARQRRRGPDAGDAAATAGRKHSSGRARQHLPAEASAGSLRRPSANSPAEEQAASSCPRLPACGEGGGERGFLAAGPTCRSVTLPLNSWSAIRHGPRSHSPAGSHSSSLPLELPVSSSRVPLDFNACKAIRTVASSEPVTHRIVEAAPSASDRAGQSEQSTRRATLTAWAWPQPTATRFAGGCCESLIASERSAVAVTAAGKAEASLNGWSLPDCGLLLLLLG